MSTSILIVRGGFLAAATALLLTTPAFGGPTRPANTRPRMPDKPPIFGIPNGGRQAAFQPGHGAFGNAQSTSSGQAAGQAGQFGQGGGAAGGAAGGGAGAFGGGGAAAFGQFGNGGIFGGGGGGFKGFSLGGGLLGPEMHYQHGVGLYGGTPSLDGVTSNRETIHAVKKPASGYHALMLHPIAVRAIEER